MNRLKMVLTEAEKTDRPFVVAVDFDGTITNEAEFKEDMELSLRDHASEVLLWMLNEGIYLILWTCRAGKVLKQATDFLDDNTIGFKSVNENYEGMPFKTSNKIFADIYIDDRNLMYGEMIDWLKIKEHVNNAFQEWKKTR